jgi:hypothetical protein
MSDEKFEISYADFLKQVYEGRVAIIREFEHQFGKERVHEILSQYYGSQAVESSKKLVESLEEPITSIEDFRKFIKSLDSRPFSMKTMNNEHPESPPGQAIRTTKHCLWADVFRELDAADIGKFMLCDTDFLTAEVFHSNIVLERSKTIMDGDDCCDFTYVWKKK